MWYSTLIRTTRKLSSKLRHNKRATMNGNIVALFLLNKKKLIVSDCFFETLTYEIVTEWRIVFHWTRFVSLYGIVFPIAFYTHLAL